MTIFVPTTDPHRPATPEADDGDGDDFFEPTLFLNEDYTLHTVAVTPDCSVTLLALDSAATDVDLTGTVIWPASILLSRWLVHVAAGGDWSVGDGNGDGDGDGDGDGGGGDSDGRPPLSPARWTAGSLSIPLAPRFLELGAGAGLAGLVAAAAFPGATALLTDGSTVVMRLLEANAAAFSPSPPAAAPATPPAAAAVAGGSGGGCGGARLPPDPAGVPPTHRPPAVAADATVRACRLRWDEPADAAAAVVAAGGPPHLLLGADVIQWPRFVAPLVATVAALLAAAPPPAAFVCAFVHRSSGCRAAYMAAAAAAGLTVSVVGARGVARLAAGLGADAGNMEIWVTRVAGGGE